MSSEQAYHTALVLFAVSVIVAIVVASITRLERVENWTAQNESAPGATGLAKARPPLDRAAGQPVDKRC